MEASYHLRRIGPPASNPQTSQIINFRKNVTTIGRNKHGADYYIGSKSKIQNGCVSRIHARVVRSGNQYKIHDDSLNGIFINHIKIDGCALLVEGDIVTFGHREGKDLAPGTRARQPDSEHQYVFEQCDCPARPPTLSEIQQPQGRRQQQQFQVPAPPARLASIPAALGRPPAQGQDDQENHEQENSDNTPLVANRPRDTRPAAPAQNTSDDSAAAGSANRDRPLSNTSNNNAISPRAHRETPHLASASQTRATRDCDLNQDGTRVTRRLQIVLPLGAIYDDGSQSSTAFPETPHGANEPNGATGQMDSDHSQDVQGTGNEGEGVGGANMDTALKQAVEDRESVLISVEHEIRSAHIEEESATRELTNQEPVLEHATLENQTVQPAIETLEDRGEPVQGAPVDERALEEPATTELTNQEPRLEHTKQEIQTVQPAVETLEDRGEPMQAAPTEACALEEPTEQGPINEESELTEVTVQHGEETVQETPIDECALEEPTVQGLANEQSTLKEKSNEEPTLEESTKEKPTVQSPIERLEEEMEMHDPPGDGCTRQEPTVQGKAVEELVVNEQAVQEPAFENLTEQPPIEGSTEPIHEPLVDACALGEVTVQKPTDESEVKELVLQELDLEESVPENPTVVPALQGTEEEKESEQEAPLKESALDEPAVRGPSVEESALEEVMGPESALEESTQETPIMRVSKMEAEEEKQAEQDPPGDKSAMEEQTVLGPVVEESALSGLTEEEPVVQESILEDSVVKKAAVNRSTEEVTEYGSPVEESIETVQAVELLPHEEPTEERLKGMIVVESVVAQAAVEESVVERVAEEVSAIEQVAGEESMIQNEAGMKEAVMEESPDERPLVDKPLLNKSEVTGSAEMAVEHVKGSDSEEAGAVRAEDMTVYDSQEVEAVTEVVLTVFDSKVEGAVRAEDMTVSDSKVEGAVREEIVTVSDSEVEGGVKEGPTDVQPTVKRFSEKEVELTLPSPAVEDMVKHEPVVDEITVDASTVEHPMTPESEQQDVTAHQAKEKREEEEVAVGDKMMEEPPVETSDSLETGAEGVVAEKTTARETAVQEVAAEDTMVEELKGQESSVEMPAFTELPVEKTCVESLKELMVQEAPQEPAVTESVMEEAAEEGVDEVTAQEVVEQEELSGKDRSSMQGSVIEEPIASEPPLKEDKVENLSAQDPALGEVVADEPAVEVVTKVLEGSATEETALLNTTDAPAQEIATNEWDQMELVEEKVAAGDKPAQEKEEVECLPVEDQVQESGINVDAENVLQNVSEPTQQEDMGKTTCHQDLPKMRSEDPCNVPSLHPPSSSEMDLLQDTSGPEVKEKMDSQDDYGDTSTEILPVTEPQTIITENREILAENPPAADSPVPVSVTDLQAEPENVPVSHVAEEMNTPVDLLENQGGRNDEHERDGDAAEGVVDEENVVSEFEGPLHLSVDESSFDDDDVSMVTNIKGKEQLTSPIECGAQMTTSDNCNKDSAGTEQEANIDEKATSRQIAMDENTPSIDNDQTDQKQLEEGEWIDTSSEVREENSHESESEADKISVVGAQDIEDGLQTDVKNTLDPVTIGEDTVLLPTTPTLDIHIVKPVGKEVDTRQRGEESFAENANIEVIEKEDDTALTVHGCKEESNDSVALVSTKKDDLVHEDCSVEITSHHEPKVTSADGQTEEGTVAEALVPTCVDGEREETLGEELIEVSPPQESQSPEKNEDTVGLHQEGDKLTVPADLDVESGRVGYDIPKPAEKTDDCMDVPKEPENAQSPTKATVPTTETTEDASPINYQETTAVYPQETIAVEKGKPFTENVVSMQEEAGHAAPGEDETKNVHEADLLLQTYSVDTSAEDQQTCVKGNEPIKSQLLFQMKDTIANIQRQLSLMTEGRSVCTLVREDDSRASIEDATPSVLPHTSEELLGEHPVKGEDALTEDPAVSDTVSGKDSTAQQEGLVTVNTEDQMELDVEEAGTNLNNHPDEDAENVNTLAIPENIEQTLHLDTEQVEPSPAGLLGVEGGKQEETEAPHFESAVPRTEVVQPENIETEDVAETKEGEEVVEKKEKIVEKEGEDVVENEKVDEVIVNEESEMVMENEEEENVSEKQEGNDVMNDEEVCIMENKERECVIENVEGEDVCVNKEGENVIENKEGEDVMVNEEEQNTVEISQDLPLHPYVGDTLSDNVHDQEEICKEPINEFENEENGKEVGAVTLSVNDKDSAKQAEYLRALSDHPDVASVESLAAGRSSTPQSTIGEHETDEAGNQPPPEIGSSELETDLKKGSELDLELDPTPQKVIDRPVEVDKISEDVPVQSDGDTLIDSTDTTSQLVMGTTWSFELQANAVEEGQETKVCLKAVGEVEVMATVDQEDEASSLSETTDVDVIPPEPDHGSATEEFVAKLTENTSEVGHENVPTTDVIAGKAEVGNDGEEDEVLEIACFMAGEEVLSTEEDLHTLTFSVNAETIQVPHETLGVPRQVMDGDKMEELDSPTEKETTEPALHDVEIQEPTEKSDREPTVGSLIDICGESEEVHGTKESIEETSSVARDSHNATSLLADAEQPNQPLEKLEEEKDFVQTDQMEIHEDVQDACKETKDGENQHVSEVLPVSKEELESREDSGKPEATSEETEQEQFLARVSLAGESFPQRTGDTEQEVSAEDAITSKTDVPAEMTSKTDVPAEMTTKTDVPAEKTTKTDVPAETESKVDSLHATTLHTQGLDSTLSSEKESKETSPEWKTTIRLGEKENVVQVSEDEEGMGKSASDGKVGFHVGTSSQVDSDGGVSTLNVQEEDRQNGGSGINKCEADIRAPSDAQADIATLENSANENLEDQVDTQESIEEGLFEACVETLVSQTEPMCVRKGRMWELESQDLEQSTVEEHKVEIEAPEQTESRKGEPAPRPETDKPIEGERYTDKVIEGERETDKVIEEDKETDNVIEEERETDKAIEEERETDKAFEGERETDKVIKGESESDKAIEREKQADKANEVERDVSLSETSDKSPEDDSHNGDVSPKEKLPAPSPTKEERSGVTLEIQTIRPPTSGELTKDAPEVEPNAIEGDRPDDTSPSVEERAQKSSKHTSYEVDGIEYKPDERNATASSPDKRDVTESSPDKRDVTSSSTDNRDVTSSSTDKHDVTASLSDEVDSAKSPMQETVQSNKLKDIDNHSASDIPLSPAPVVDQSELGTAVESISETVICEKETSSDQTKSVDKDTSAKFEDETGCHETIPGDDLPQVSSEDVSSNAQNGAEPEKCQEGVVEEEKTRVGSKKRLVDEVDEDSSDDDDPTLESEGKRQRYHSSSSIEYPLAEQTAKPSDAQTFESDSQGDFDADKYAEAEEQILSDTCIDGKDDNIPVSPQATSHDESLEEVSQGGKSPVNVAGLHSDVSGATDADPSKTLESLNKPETSTTSQNEPASEVPQADRDTTDIECVGQDMQIQAAQRASLVKDDQPIDLDTTDVEDENQDTLGNVPCVSTPKKVRPSDQDTTDLETTDVEDVNQDTLVNVPCVSTLKQVHPRDQDTTDLDTTDAEDENQDTSVKVPYVSPVKQVRPHDQDTTDAEGENTDTMAESEGNTNTDVPYSSQEEEFHSANSQAMSTECSGGEENEGDDDVSQSDGDVTETFSMSESDEYESKNDTLTEKEHVDEERDGTDSDMEDKERRKANDDDHCSLFSTDVSDIDLSQKTPDETIPRPLVVVPDDDTNSSERVEKLSFSEIEKIFLLGRRGSSLQSDDESESTSQEALNNWKRPENPSQDESSTSDLFKVGNVQNATFDEHSYVQPSQNNRRVCETSQETQGTCQIETLSLPESMQEDKEPNEVESPTRPCSASREPSIVWESGENLTLVHEECNETNDEIVTLEIREALTTPGPTQEESDGQGPRDTDCVTKTNLQEEILKIEEETPTENEDEDHLKATETYCKLQGEQIGPSHPTPGHLEEEEASLTENEKSIQENIDLISQSEEGKCVAKQLSEDESEDVRQEVIEKKKEESTQSVAQLTEGRERVETAECLLQQPEESNLSDVIGQEADKSTDCLTQEIKEKIAVDLMQERVKTPENLAQHPEEKDESDVVTTKSTECSTQQSEDEIAVDLMQEGVETAECLAQHPDESDVMAAKSTECFNQQIEEKIVVDIRQEGVETVECLIPQPEEKERCILDDRQETIEFTECLRQLTTDKEECIVVGQEATESTECLAQQIEEKETCVVVGQESAESTEYLAPQTEEKEECVVVVAQELEELQQTKEREGCVVDASIPDNPETCAQNTDPQDIMPPQMSTNSPDVNDVELTSRSTLTTLSKLEKSPEVNFVLEDVHVSERKDEPVPQEKETAHLEDHQKTNHSQSSVEEGQFSDPDSDEECTYPSVLGASQQVKPVSNMTPRAVVFPGHSPMSTLPQPGRTISPHVGATFMHKQLSRSATKAPSPLSPRMLGPRVSPIERPRPTRRSEPTGCVQPKTIIARSGSSVNASVTSETTVEASLKELELQVQKSAQVEAEVQVPNAAQVETSSHPVIPTVTPSDLLTSSVTPTLPGTENVTSTKREEQNATSTCPETQNATLDEPETQNATSNGPETQNATLTELEKRNATVTESVAPRASPLEPEEVNTGESRPLMESSTPVKSTWIPTVTRTSPRQAPNHFDGPSGSQVATRDPVSHDEEAKEPPLGEDQREVAVVVEEVIVSYEAGISLKVLSVEQRAPQSGEKETTVQVVECKEFQEGDLPRKDQLVSAYGLHGVDSECESSASPAPDTNESDDGKETNSRPYISETRVPASDNSSCEEEQRLLPIPEDKSRQSIEEVVVLNAALIPTSTIPGGCTPYYMENETERSHVENSDKDVENSDKTGCRVAREVDHCQVVVSQPQVVEDKCRPVVCLEETDLSAGENVAQLQESVLAASVVGIPTSEDVQVFVTGASESTAPDEHIRVTMPFLDIASSDEVEVFVIEDQSKVASEETEIVVVMDQPESTICTSPVVVCREEPEEVPVSSNCVETEDTSHTNVRVSSIADLSIQVEPDQLYEDDSPSPTFPRTRPAVGACNNKTPILIAPKSPETDQSTDNNARWSMEKEPETKTDRVQYIMEIVPLGSAPPHSDLATPLLLEGLDRSTADLSIEIPPSDGEAVPDSQLSPVIPFTCTLPQNLASSGEVGPADLALSETEDPAPSQPLFDDDSDDGQTSVAIPSHALGSDSETASFPSTSSQRGFSQKREKRRNKDCSDSDFEAPSITFRSPLKKRTPKKKRNKKKRPMPDSDNEDDEDECQCSQDSQEPTQRSGASQRILARIRSKRRKRDNIEPEVVAPASPLSDSPGDEGAGVSRKLQVRSNVNEDRADEYVERAGAIIEKARDILKSNLKLTSMNRVNVWLKEIDELKKRAKLPETIIAVVGDTGSGKSSLMNALIGHASILPTSGMRACTAVVVQVKDNPNSQYYEGEIEFLEKQEWLRELETLLKELQGADGRVRACQPEPNSDVIVAWTKVRAVYGSFPDGVTINTLPKMSHVTGYLGKTKVVKETSPAAFRKRVDHYIESTSGRDGGQYWPIVKKVSLRIPNCSICSSGATLVDLPGIRDSNAARDKIAKEYLQSCTAVWVVAPIHRAVDDKTAKELLGEHFKRQLLMDGQYGSVSFVCTKTDILRSSELIRGLNVDDEVAPFEEALSELSAEEVALRDDQKFRRDEIHRLRTQVEEMQEEQTELQTDLTDLTQAVMDEAEEEDVDEEVIEERAKMKDLVKQKAGEIKLVREKIKEHQKEVEASKVKILDLEKKISATRRSISSICALARNDFARGEIKRDFKAGLREMKRRAGGSEDTYDDEDEFESDSEDEDILKTTDKLKVFCVSSTEYLKLRKLLPRKDGPPQVFQTVSETGIPGVEDHVHVMTRVRRLQGTEQLVKHVNQFVHNIESYLMDEGTKNSFTRGAAQDVVEDLITELKDTDISDVQKEAMSEINITFDSSLKRKIYEGKDLAITQAEATVAKWGTKVVKDNRSEGGLHFSTYKAVVRRYGVFKSPAAGNIDFNEDLTSPVYASITIVWDKVFNTMMCQHLDNFKTQVLAAIRAFTQNIQGALRPIGMALDRLRRTEHNLHQRVDHTISMALTETKAFIAERQREINRVVTPYVQKELQPAYDLCNQESGVGTYNRMKEHMRKHVTTDKHVIFDGSSDRLLDQLQQLEDEIRGLLGVIIQRVIADCDQAYEPFWEEPSNTRAFRKAFLDGIQNCISDVEALSKDADVQLPNLSIAPAPPKRTAPTATASSSQAINPSQSAAGVTSGQVLYCGCYVPSSDPQRIVNITGECDLHGSLQHSDREENPEQKIPEKKAKMMPATNRAKGAQGSAAAAAAAASAGAGPLQPAKASGNLPRVDVKPKTSQGPTASQVSRYKRSLDENVYPPAAASSAPGSALKGRLGLGRSSQGSPAPQVRVKPEPGMPESKRQRVMDHGLIDLTQTDSEDDSYDLPPLSQFFR